MKKLTDFLLIVFLVLIMPAALFVLQRQMTGADYQKDNLEPPESVDWCKFFCVGLMYSSPSVAATRIKLLL